MSRPSRARTIFRYCRACKAAARRAETLLSQTGAGANALRQDAEYAAHNAQARRLWHNLPPTIRAAVLPEGD